MRKRGFWIFALGLCAACTEAGLRQSQLTLGGTPQRIAGTGDLAQPRFAGGSGSFLAITDGGRPNMVFVVTATTLEVEPVSFRLPPPGVPATPTAIGEVVRDLLVTPDDDSSGGAVTGTKSLAVFLSEASNLLEPGTGIFFFRDSPQAFLKDVATGENFLVSADPDGLPGNGDVTSVVISASGRFVAFATNATNLYVPVNPSQAPNGASQIYVLDLFTGALQVVSMTDDGAPGAGDSTEPVITPDGRFVAFRSLAANLVDGDTNMTADVFLYDRTKRTTERISVDFGGTQEYVDAAEPAMSEDGTIVAFTAVNVNTMGPRQVYLRDRDAGTTTILSRNGPIVEGNGGSSGPSVSGDGQLVAFASAASDLDSSDVEGFTDVFVFDRSTLQLSRASIDADGTGGGNGDSREPSLSPDGNFLAYISDATNVAFDDEDRPDGDANGLADLILAPLQ